MQRVHCFAWVLFPQGECTVNWLFYAGETKTHLKLQSVSLLTPIGVQKENSFLAFDVHQAYLERTGQIVLISFPLLLLYIYYTGSMSPIKQKKKEIFFLAMCFHSIQNAVMYPHRDPGTYEQIMCPLLMSG